MTRALRLQGRVFCGIAAILFTVSLVGARPEPGREILAVGALLLLLGMPHGALDVVVARTTFGVSQVTGWAAFTLRYLGLAALVVAVWLVAPTFFLCAFLILSALHFGGDPAAGVSRFSRILYGGAVIVLPSLWHAAELQALLAIVAGATSATAVVPILGHLAAPWLAAMALAIAHEWRTSRLAACEIAGLAVISVAAPPLVAFCAYFCAMHSPRHILRTFAGLDAWQTRHALLLVLWPTLAVLVVAVLVVLSASSFPMEQRVMQVVFVGLAALTLPHMVLLERVRRDALKVDTDD